MKIRTRLRLAFIGLRYRLVFLRRRFTAAEIKKQVKRYYYRLRRLKVSVACELPRPVTADDLEQLSDAEINELVIACVKAGLLSRAFLKYPIPLEEHEVRGVGHSATFIILTRGVLPNNPTPGCYMLPSGDTFIIEEPDIEDLEDF
jgi:hypothetical protein